MRLHFICYAFVSLAFSVKFPSKSFAWADVPGCNVKNCPKEKRTGENSQRIILLKSSIFSDSPQLSIKIKQTDIWLNWMKAQSFHYYYQYSNLFRFKPILKIISIGKLYAQRKILILILHYPANRNSLKPFQLWEHSYYTLMFIAKTLIHTV